MSESRGTGSRVLVTGTSGFIAGHLAARLVALGHEVCGLDQIAPTRPIPGVRYVVCDIRSGEALRAHVQAFAPEFILHLAARTDLDETRDLRGYDANIVGVSNLAAAVAATPSVRRTVCTSSQLVCRIGYVPKSELDYQPNTLYGESKVRTEQLWREADGGGREWCIVRPTTIWGPWMNPHYLRFFRMIRDGRYRHVGRTAPRKSYGYVGNTVQQFVRLLEAPASQIHRRMFFVADYEALDLRSWADAFQVALGAPAIGTMPLVVAQVAARIGDLVKAVGFRRFPFNSFRLNNVLSGYEADVGPTRLVCGALPYTMTDGVDATASWLRTVL